MKNKIIGGALTREKQQYQKLVSSMYSIQQRCHNKHRDDMYFLILRLILSIIYAYDTLYILLRSDMFCMFCSDLFCLELI